MKLLHTSDWHLGASEGVNSFNEDQRYFIDEICRIIEEHKIQAVLLAGDVYDRSVASKEAISLYDYAMTKICGELQVPIMIIAGNHDSAERLSICRELLSNSGLHVCGALQREPAIVSYEDVEVFLLPWITEEKVRSIFPEKKESIKTLTDAYRVVTEHYKTYFSEGKRHIILSHAFVNGGVGSDSDKAVEIGFASQIPLNVFEGFDYVALGHLHGPQNIGDIARYSGTPMPYAFGKEERQEKSVTVIDTMDMSREIVPIPLLHQRNTLTGELDELLNLDVSEDVRNGYVWLKMTDSYASLDAISRLRSVYPNALIINGKSYEGENTTISLTLDELEQMETDPAKIFQSFCEDISEEASEHRLELFCRAVEKVERGDAE